MDYILLKKKLLDTCIALRTRDALDSENAMKELQKSANEYGMPKDRYDSYRTQLLRRRDLFAEKVQSCLDDLKILRKINLTEKKKSIELGSLVITNKHKLFVSVSLGKITLDGTLYMAVSPAVPIIQALKDKKAGEDFVFNGQKLRILDIY
jgi:hypothetical protein